ncbi:MAG: hypothetical protein CMH70_03515 [Nitrosomonadaceae bacterium]|nr:hypothetical protein [Nitrosomonadaceae bacterium]
MVIILFFSKEVYSQEIIKLTNNLISPFKVSGYVETYGSTTFSNSLNNKKSPIFVSYNRNNEPAVNLAFFKIKYDIKNVKANFALAAGTYMRSNYKEEPGLLKNLYEANIALKILKENNTWLEIGTFSSHIGFENAKGSNNWTLTRSLTAENVPYYESGARINHTSNDGKWFMSALILTGWQSIKPIDGNTLPSFGTQITYKPSSNITLNSSTFIGTDTPNHSRLMRYFHNFYSTLKLSNKLAATVGFDIGMEQKRKGSSTFNKWFNSTVIIRYTPTKNTAMAIRGEYFDDRDSVLLSSIAPNSFRTWAFSANFDWHITKNFLWRFEARSLINKDNIFTKQDGTTTETNTALTTALAINF